MLFRDVISLISFTDVINDMGDSVRTPVERSGIFADKKSIRQSEFYQAAAAGLRPEMMFVIRSGDYQGELTLKYGSTQYTIIRTYDKNGEFIELICQGLVN